MKNIFYILLLLPTIIFAQYPSNSGQKITLGEQTTADGLVYRGVANDTNVITPFSDTSAYIILDTVNSKFYHYNRTTTFWALAGGGGDSGGVTSFSAGTTGLTPSTATTGAVTLGGTLAVANGGTNTGTLTANKVMVGNGTGGVLTPTNLHWDNTNSRLGIGTSSPIYKLDISGGNLRLSNNTSILFLTSEGANASAVTMTSSNNLNIGQPNANFAALNLYGGTGNTNIYAGSASVATFNTSGNVGIGMASPTARLHVTGSGVTSSTTALKVDNSGNTNLLTVLDNGNVGIGTTLPASRFHIKQSADAHSGGLKLERFSGTNTYSLNIDANNNLNLGYATTASTSTNRLVIDANGNVGIGTTPSAWRNIFTAFQFGSTGSFYSLIPSFNAEEMNFASNYYQDSDGLERRIINGYTERLRLKSGRFEFDAAGFGLSNSVISFNRRLLIDSTGNVGIGTESPNSKLHIKGPLNIERTNTTDYSIIDNEGNLNIKAATGGAGGNFNTVFFTSGTEKMRLNTDGNVGIGVVPSAWDASAKVLQIGNFVALANYTDYMDLSTNTFYDGQYKYLNSSRAAATYSQTGGQHRFYIAPLGTAGAAITFTQAMTILNNGNVGIGTASPAEKLVVTGAIMSTSGITGHGANRTTISQEGANGAFWQSYGANTSTAGIFQLRQASSDFSIQRVPLYIDASGKVGIGTASPDEPLHVVKSTSTTNSITEVIHVQAKTTGTLASGFGPSIGFWGALTGGNNVELGQIGAVNTNINGANGDLVFYTRPNAPIVERMRITSGGNVGIGTTTPTARLQVKGSTNASEFALKVDDSGSNTLLSVQNNSSIKFQYGTGGATVTDGIAIKRFSPDVASRSTMEISGTSSDWVSGKGLVFNNHTLGIIFGAQTHFSSAVSTNQLWIGDSQIGSVDDFIVFSTGTPGFVDILATKYAGGPYPNMRISAPNISFFTKTGATWPDGGGSSSYGTEIMTLMGSSNIKMNSVVYNNTTTSNTRTLFIGGDYTIGGISSIRASKKNIENVSNVDWLYELNPVTFNYRKKDLEGNYLEEVYEDKNYGLIAEDTKPVADFLINYNDKEDGTKEMIGIEYSRLITPLLKAVQELSAEIDILKQEIINLKNK